jgi:hypothetical protein
MKTPNKYRVTKGVMSSDDSYGNNGFFIIPLSNRTYLQVISSDEMDWEHVSVVSVSDKKPRTPSWSEMCKVKDMFWEENDCVIQYHPPKSEYVNNHQNCLHLWKPKNSEIIMPPSELVGIKL